MNPTIRKPEILIVDDEDAIRQSLGRLLRTHGFDVVTAATLPEAVEYAEQRPIDAFILDLSLKEKESGLDFLGWLRAQGGYQHTPVLILTGQSVLPEDEEALIRRQRAYVFYKPQPYGTLIDYLRQLTGHSAPNAVSH